MTETVKINGNEFEAIRITLSDQQLIVIFACQLLQNYSFQALGIVFIGHNVYVSLCYINDVIEWLDNFCISPDIKLNQEYWSYKIKLQSQQAEIL